MYSIEFNLQLKHLNRLIYLVNHVLENGDRDMWIGEKQPTNSDTNNSNTTSASKVHYVINLGNKPLNLKSFRRLLLGHM